MTRSLFIANVIMSWAIVIVGILVSSKITYWMLPFVIAAAFALLRAAFRARSSELGMEKTGRSGISAYMIGFVFLGIALFLDRTFTLPRFVLGILGGAGVWSIAITWLCAVALINGGWYVKK